MKSRCKFAFFVCLIVIVCSCDKKRIESTDIYSPNKKLVLRIEIDETGAAAVPDVTSVLVFPSNGSDKAGKLIFKGSAMSRFHADWRGQDEIDISYSNGYLSYCEQGPVILLDQTVRIVGCK